MWSKRNRYAVCVRLFEDLYWAELGDTAGHEHFSASEIDVLMPGEKTEAIDNDLITTTSEYFQTKTEEYFRQKFEGYMDDWDKTLLPVKAVLYAWVMEYELTGVEPGELVGKYIKLTQDIIAGGSTSLVHALLSKMTGTYHPVEDEPKEDTDNSRGQTDTGDDQRAVDPA